MNSQNTGWLFRIFLFGAGAAAGSLAIWELYFRRWLGATSRLDAWFDRHGCDIPSLCSSDFSLAGQTAVLLAGAAVALFASAFWSYPGIWRTTPSAAGAPPPGDARWKTTRWIIWPLLAAGFGFVAYQANIALSGAAPPARMWLLGLGAFLSAAALRDASRPANLARTAANLVVAVGITAIVLGAGCFMAGKAVSAALLLVGGIVFSLGSRWTVRAGSECRPIEHCAMLAFALAALVLTMSRVWSWHFAYIGDEWNFFNRSREVLHEEEFWLLGARDPGDYHVNFSFFFQAAVMRLAGENVFGWRLSSVLPFALSVPPLFVFLRWLVGPAGAILGAGLFAFSHVLQTFSLAGYNNTQALLPLTLGLGLFAFASGRPSAIRYCLVGISLGLGLFVYGLARMAVVPVGAFMLAYARPLRTQIPRAWVPALSGALAAAVPMLFNLSNWQAMLRATPADVRANPVAIGGQMLLNTVRGLLAFLLGTKNTHFLSGPHADPTTAFLLLVGLGSTLGSFFYCRGARVWLFASTLFVIGVSAIQQYPDPANTRMFILPSVYAVLAAIGGTAVAHLLFPAKTTARTALISALLVAAAGLNLLHVERVSLPNIHRSLENLVVKQFEETAASSGGGMQVFLSIEPKVSPLLGMVLRAHDIGRERLSILSPAEALQSLDLCLAGGSAAMALVVARDTPVDAVRQRIAECWPGHRERAVPADWGRPLMYRFLTAGGVREESLPSASRQTTRPEPDTLAAYRPRDLGVDSNGTLFVLSLNGRVFRFAAGSTTPTNFPLVQTQPTAMALTPDDTLVVAGRDRGQQLVWYDGRGEVVGQSGREVDLGIPRGLAVAPTGEIAVVDEIGRRVLCLSPRGEVTCELRAGGQLNWPSSVAYARDGSVWVLNASGQLLLVSRQDEVLRTLDVPRTSSDRPRRMLVALDGDLIMAEPEAGRVVRLNEDGQLVHVWSGFSDPHGLAADVEGRLLVSETSTDSIAVLPPVKDL